MLMCAHPFVHVSVSFMIFRSRQRTARPRILTWSGPSRACGPDERSMGTPWTIQQFNLHENFLEWSKGSPSGKSSHPVPSVFGF